MKSIRPATDHVAVLRHRIRWSVLQLIAFEAPDELEAETLNEIAKHVLALVDDHLLQAVSDGRSADLLRWAIQETWLLIDEAQAKPTISRHSTLSKRRAL